MSEFACLNLGFHDVRLGAKAEAYLLVAGGSVLSFYTTLSFGYWRTDLLAITNQSFDRTAYLSSTLFNVQLR
jgi:hypothetical protein